MVMIIHHRSPSPQCVPKPWLSTLFPQLLPSDQSALAMHCNLTAMKDWIKINCLKLNSRVLLSRSDHSLVSLSHDLINQAWRTSAVWFIRNFSTTWLISKNILAWWSISGLLILKAHQTTFGWILYQYFDLHQLFIILLIYILKLIKEKVFSHSHKAKYYFTQKVSINGSVPRKNK